MFNSTLYCIWQKLKLKKKLLRLDTVSYASTVSKHTPRSSISFTTLLSHRLVSYEYGSISGIKCLLFLFRAWLELCCYNWTVSTFNKYMYSRRVEKTSSLAHCSCELLSRIVFLFVCVFSFFPLGGEGDFAPGMTYSHALSPWRVLEGVRLLRFYRALACATWIVFTEQRALKSFPLL